MDIAFEFIGGPYSGATIKSRGLDAFQSSLLYGWYAQTNCGQPGQRFWAAGLRHDEQTGEVIGLAEEPYYYEVIERVEAGGELLIRCRCLGGSQFVPTEPTRDN